PASAGSTVLLSPASAGASCTLRSVTSVDAYTDTAQQKLYFDATGTESSYNEAAFTTPANYAAGDRASVPGSLLLYRYRVTSGKLEQFNQLDSTTATLTRNVVAMRAQYGVSTGAGQTTVSSWVDPSGSWATVDSTNITRIRAMRIQLLLKSPQREKVN